MLELIVLGQIPGTNVVLTFTWVLALSSFMSGMLIAHQAVRQRSHDEPMTHKSKKNLPA